MPTTKRAEMGFTGQDSHAAERRLMATMRHAARSQEDIEFCMEYLAAELLFFQELPESARRAFATHGICEHVPPGDTLMKADDHARVLYLVWSGSGTVYSGAPLAEGLANKKSDAAAAAHARNRRMFGNNFFHCHRGDTFGHAGLLDRIVAHKDKIEDPETIPAQECGTTVLAHPVDGMVCLEVNFHIFLKHIYPFHEELCWAPSRCSDVLSQKPEDRSEDDLEMVRRFVARIPFFAQLSIDNQKKLCRVMQQEAFAPDHPIVFQEGWLGESFYVITSGSVSVHVRLSVDEIKAREKHAQEQNERAEKEQEEEEENKAVEESDSSNRPEFHDRSSTDIAKRYSDFEAEFGPAVAELRHGDSFGEKALHSKSATRNATIVCRSKSLLLMVVDRQSYNEIIRPKNGSIIMNISAAMKAIDTPPDQRTDEDAGALIPLVEKIAFFKQLPAQIVRKLVKRIRLVEIPPQRVICEQGSEGDTMYVIISGSCAVFLTENRAQLERLRVDRAISGHTKSLRRTDHEWDGKNDPNHLWSRKGKGKKSKHHQLIALGTSNNDGAPKSLLKQEEENNLADDPMLYPPAVTTPHWYGPCRANLLSGDSFGEQSVINAAPRNATVITRENTRLVVVSRNDYNMVAQLGHLIQNPSKCIRALSKSPINRTPSDIDSIYGLFSQMSFFRQLPTTTVHKLAQVAGYGKVEANTPILVQGDIRCNGFYVGLSGSVSVHVLKNKESVPLDDLATANIQLPMTEEEAHEGAIRELTKDVTKFGADLGDGTLDENALYIRHEHRLHLPHSEIPNAFNNTGFNPADNIDAIFGRCVACLGPSDTFGELSIHKEEDHVEEEDGHVVDTSAGGEVHRATEQAHASVRRGSHHRVHPPSSSRPNKPKSLRAGRGKFIPGSAAASAAAAAAGVVARVVQRRTATVISREPSEFLIIDNTTFDSLLKNATINFEPELARRVLSKEASTRTTDDIKILRNLLHTIEFFDEMPRTILAKMCKCIEFAGFAKGEVIFKAGDAADCMYVVLSGKVSIRRHESHGHDEGHDHDYLDLGSEFSSGSYRENKQWSLLHASIATVANMTVKGHNVSRTHAHAGQPKSTPTVNTSNTASATKRLSKSGAPGVAHPAKETPKVFKSLSQAIKLADKHDTEAEAAPFNSPADAAAGDQHGDLVSVASMGDCLGEKSLLSKIHTRQLTLTTLSNTAELIRINKADFDDIIAGHADELDFHANLTYRAVREATRIGKSVRGQVDIIRPLCRKVGLAESRGQHSLKGNNATVLEQLYRVLDAKYFENGAHIYNAGASPFLVFVVVQGAVELLIPIQDEATSSTSSPKIPTKEALANGAYLGETNGGMWQVVAKVGHGQSFGASELLLDVPRQTSARAVGNTVVLAINKLVYQRHWRNVHDSGESLLADIMKRNTRAFGYLTPYQNSMVITMAEEKLFPRYSEIKTPGSQHRVGHGEGGGGGGGGGSGAKGFMVLVQGECEVSTQRHSLTQEEEGKEPEHHHQHHQQHHHHHHHHHHQQPYGGSANQRGRQQSSQASQSKHVKQRAYESPIKRRLDKSRKRIPPAKFSNAKQIPQLQSGDDSTCQARKKKYSSQYGRRMVLGLIGPGFALDASGLPHGVRLKCLSETRFMYLSHDAYHSFVPNATRMRLASTKKELLGHLRSNHGDLMQRREFAKKTAALTMAGVTSRPEVEGGGGGDVKSASSVVLKNKLGSTTKSVVFNDNTSMELSTGFEGGHDSGGELDNLCVLPDISVPANLGILTQGRDVASGTPAVLGVSVADLTKPRLNYSRAGMRSDWKFRPMNKVGEESELTDGGTTSFVSPTFLTNMPVLAELNDGVFPHESAPPQPRKPSKTSTAILEEADLVRVLSPRLEQSKRLRFRRNRKKRKPLTGRARRDHLSKLFFRGVQTYTPVARGASRAAVRNASARSSSGGGGDRFGSDRAKSVASGMVPKVGPIEVFDSRNYAGGSYAGSFW